MKCFERYKKDKKRKEKEKKKENNNNNNIIKRRKEEANKTNKRGNEGVFSLSLRGTAGGSSSYAHVVHMLCINVVRGK